MPPCAPAAAAFGLPAMERQPAWPGRQGGGACRLVAEMLLVVGVRSTRMSLLLQCSSLCIVGRGAWRARGQRVGGSLAPGRPPAGHGGSRLRSEVLVQASHAGLLALCLSMMLVQPACRPTLLSSFGAGKPRLLSVYWCVGRLLAQHRRVRNSLKARATADW